MVWFRAVGGAPKPRRGLVLGACVALLALSTGCGGGSGGGGATPPVDGGDGGGGGGGGGSPGGNGDATEPVRVLATAGQAVAWMDAEYSTYGFLAPHAVVRAQVVKPDGGAGKPLLLDDTQVSLFYEAIADEAGSINSTSLGKTDLWAQPPQRLFGVDLPPGRGIFGLSMPADAARPGRQPFAWKPDGWFVADGIPITPVDDEGAVNELPRLRITAVDRATGLDLGHADVTVPVSRIAGCVVCHATGSLASVRPGTTWSAATDLERQSRENVLLLHDAKHATRLSSGKPAACGLCHFTQANGLTGWGSAPDSGWLPLSRAIHGAHAAFLDPTGAPVFPAQGNAAQTCARCHVSSHASRGAMAKSGLDCTDCHGSMAAVSGSAALAAGGSRDGTRDGAPRRPFADEPRCESCHIGDAVSRTVAPQFVVAADGFRLAQAFATGDAAASPIRRDGTRFAPAAATPFHLGKGHGGLRCEACHGGAHAEWSRDRGEAFDAALSTRYQGHAGTMVECSTCHPAGTLALTTGGPHGMHNVGDERWAAGGHASFRTGDPASCEACHGKDLAGTVLSRAAADRTYALPGRTVTIPKGMNVGCGMCHVSHDTSAAWIAGAHGAAYDADPAGCRTCHGANLAGTAQSTAAVDRSYTVSGNTYSIAAGTQVGCATCHVSHVTTLAWVDGGHGAGYTADPADCATCHGADGKGSSLSVAAAARSYTVNGKTFSIATGATVGCATCHVPHATALAWVDGGHGPEYASDPGGCATCHGAQGAGTVLSKAAAARSYTVNGKTYGIASGATVGCATCHVPHATTSTYVTATHGPAYEASPGDCTSCHGTDLKGTLLSKTAAARSFTYGRRTTTFTSGETVTCAKCHVPHATTSSFVNGHDSLYENDKVSCQMCHGTSLRGASFSVAAADRSFSIDGRTVTIKQGTKVTCTLCHSMP